MRKLAEKTATATKVIGKIVLSIKDGTVNAVNSMEMITQIATASSQQSSASEEISRNIEGIKDSILQTSEGTEHNVKLADEMQRSVEGLNSVISKFKV